MRMRALSDHHCGHQLGEPDKIEHPPETIGQRGQTELGAYLLQTSRCRVAKGFDNLFR
jgi:hypothetical protein